MVCAIQIFSLFLIVSPYDQVAATTEATTSTVTGTDDTETTRATAPGLWYKAPPLSWRSGIPTPWSLCCGLGMCSCILHVIFLNQKFEDHVIYQPALGPRGLEKSTLARSSRKMNCVKKQWEGFCLVVGQYRLDEIGFNLSFIRYPSRYESSSWKVPTASTPTPRILW